MSGRLPDFIVIGAMKCATSTLHTQLAGNGCFMSEPKEPCYFSDDHVFERGPAWYHKLFEGAREGQLIGESSTHYTKLPTYPNTVERMRTMLPDVRLVYVIRDPLDRIVSQYIHEWTERQLDCSLSDAIRQTPRLVDYSRYAMQLRAYFDAFGHDRVQVVFFERLRSHPQEQLERVARFIGMTDTVQWHEGEAENVSSERLRLSPLAKALLFNPVATALRRALVPRTWRDRVKARAQMSERPRLSPEDRALLSEALDADMGTLGQWLGLPELSCASFRRVASETPNPSWVSEPLGERMAS